MPARPDPTQAEADRPDAYVPRRPEHTTLYRTVASSLETFVARAREQERVVPRFVEREFRGFLDCGILAHGFLRVRCDACRCERLVPFSCKGRGFCPSCGGRRMADTAAHLVDRVLPVAPVRQWVVTLPWALRYRMAYDAALTGDILREPVRAVFRSLRHTARVKRGLRGRLQCGAVTFVQRFGDALNLNVHFHVLALDGVFETPLPGSTPDTPPRFHPLPPPDDREVARVAARIARRVGAVLRRRGIDDQGADPCEVDPLFNDEPFLATLCGASVRGRIATGRRAGQRVLRFGDRVDAEDLPDDPGAEPPPRCARVAGVSIHANVAVPARDRRRLERLCRYVARPPLASERLSRLQDGRLLYRLKRRWTDGTTHVVFEPLELIEKLAALVPPPRVNLVRYHGILAPAARHRRALVSKDHPQDKNAEKDARAGAAHPSVGPPSHGGTAAPTGTTADASDDPDRKVPRTRLAPPGSSTGSRARYYTWAELMRRVFAVDVLECPRCHEPMRILAQIHPPDTTRAILECLSLPIRPPPVCPAREAGLDDTGQFPDPGHPVPQLEIQIQP